MSSGRLAAKALLLAMFAYAPGCADTGAEDAAEGNAAEGSEVSPEQESALKDAIEGAKASGQSFESGGGEAADSDLPVAELATEGEPSFAYLSRKGPHPVGRFNLNGQGWNKGTVYYPNDSSTDLAGVVMCPGFTASQPSIADWGPFFASHGIVLLTIDTNTTMDYVPSRATQIQNALKTLQSEPNALKGRMGDRWGVSGWSMGGGGSWITGAKLGPQALKTVVSLAGHNQTAGGARGVNADRMQVPTLLMNGSQDTTILGGMGQSKGVYKAIPNSTPKLHWETGSCGHFCWGTPNTGNNVSGVLMMAWQKTYLEGDERFKSLLVKETTQRGSTTTFETNVN